jgi:GcrA cell cycle regulator
MDAKRSGVRPARDSHMSNGPLLTILQVTAKTCKWPIGDPGHAGFGFCGAPPRDNAPYCDHHCGLAYTGLQTLRRVRTVRPDVRLIAPRQRWT